MSDKIIEFLKENDVEITDDLKKGIKNIWDDKLPDTEDLFTQEELDDIIESRLGRQKKSYESEIEDLKNEMEDLIDPEKVKEYENKIEELESKSEEREKSLKTDYELKLAAKNAGIEDQDYFEYLVEKKSLKERMKLDDDGNVIATDEDGNTMIEEGKKLGPEILVNEIKEEKPDIFGESKKDKNAGGGGGNPGGGGPKDKKKNTESMAMELGYKTKKESE